jgi:folate-dependent phosphoribosylglycinamide formyltransferase PurN
MEHRIYPAAVEIVAREAYEIHGRVVVLKNR